MTAHPDAPAARVAAFLVPADVDAPSGGNIYDRRIAAGLADLGWSARLVRVPGSGGENAREAALEAALAGLPAGSVAVVDGLVGHRHPGTLGRHAHRLVLVSVVHLLLCDEHGLPADEAARLRAREREALRAVAAVITTSEASRRRVLDQGMHRRTVVVVEPGTDPAAPARGSDGIHQWLCPAAVTPHKDQAGLLEALRQVADVAWRCRCVGPLDRAPAYAAEVAATAHRAGLADRFVLAGPRTGPALEQEYARADLVVLPSRFETYGMVLAEALARGIPVVSTTAGGIPDTVLRGDAAPGLLVPPGDPAALAGALRAWATDADLRAALRAAARARPAGPTWAEQARCFAGVLAGVLAGGRAEVHP